MIHIFDKFNEIEDSTYNVLFNLLPTSRKQKAEERNGINKKIAIIEYFMLKNLLKFEGFPDFQYLNSGKPLLNGYNFSISHADNILCIAIADVNVGVDIEKVAEYNPQIAEFVLNAEELELINKSKNKALAFTKLYTQKEATIKCLGLTMSCDIKNIINKNKFIYKFKLNKDYIICECVEII